MTSRDTGGAGGGGQERQGRRSEDTDVEPDGVEDASAAVSERKAAIDEDVDAMLDEIDEVLETNAEEFVRGFVQKGGE